MSRDEVDFVAFVALDIRRVAYVPSSVLVAADGEHLIQAIWMRPEKTTSEAIGMRWRIQESRMMRCMADFSTFALVATG